MPILLFVEKIAFNNVVIQQSGINMKSLILYVKPLLMIIWEKRLTKHFVYAL